MSRQVLWFLVSFHNFVNKIMESGLTSHPWGLGHVRINKIVCRRLVLIVVPWKTETSWQQIGGCHFNNAEFHQPEFHHGTEEWEVCARDASLFRFTCYSQPGSLMVQKEKKNVKKLNNYVTVRTNGTTTPFCFALILFLFHSISISLFSKRPAIYSNAPYLLRYLIFILHIYTII